MSFYTRTFEILVREVEIVLLVALETLKGAAITFTLKKKNKKL